MKPLGALWRLVHGVLLALAALVVFIEEFGWRPLAAVLARVARWPPLARLEARIVRAPPRLALVLFLVPAVLLFPVKIVAIGLVHAGRTALGIGVLIGAKLLGTALVGRLFVLLEPQLMQFERFRRAVLWWRATRERVRLAVVASPLWRETVARLNGLKARWRHWFVR